MGDGGLCELFADGCDRFRHASDADDLFSIIDTWEECMRGGGGGTAASAAAFSPSSVGGAEATAVGARPTAVNSRRREGDREKGGGCAPVQKKHKGSTSAAADNEGAAKVSHITVERNRRKQMNEHLAVLRSLMPCFYVKRGDQATIIGGVVEYIKELQQILYSLDAKKHRKAYTEQVLSPRPASTASSYPPPHSPQPLIKSTPPLSPRLPVPISPRTPTPGSPYKPYSGGGGAGRLPHPAAAYMSPTSSSSHSHELSLQPFLPTLDSIVTELAAHAARPVAAGGGACLLLPDVKVEFAGPNLVLKMVSRRAPGQALKIIAALESLSLEILHVSISTVDDAMVHSFTIKIGIECELSAEELVREVQRCVLA